MRGIYISGDLEMDFSLIQKGKRAQIVDYAWVAADELPVGRWADTWVGTWADEWVGA